MSESAGERRCRLAPGAAVGITEDMIDAQVRAFYAKVRIDPNLGPIFASVVDDWEPHLLRMIDFWSSVLLMSGRYKGNPVAKHSALDLHAAHFAKWLCLFVETAGETCPAAAADLFRQKAEMIAESLQMSAAIARGDTSKPSLRTIPPTEAARCGKQLLPARDP
ncbi:group III truncated hemoglobin [Zavarzinia compransoris]|uniref:group III truncated hemoglobin n=1 Tax=Zavarzinia compransoris TaxID=1264899 RepID=UPI001AAC4E06|nr:group III truncated hemoglobin [Zavarzinia compransoris]